MTEDNENEQKAYSVEVCVERTGTIRVMAEDEQDARLKARERAERGGGLSFSHSFTNNVREVDSVVERVDSN